MTVQELITSLQKIEDKQRKIEFTIREPSGIQYSNTNNICINTKDENFELFTFSLLLTAKGRY